MAKEKNPAFGDKVITGECRASFPKLDKPDESKYGQGKYSIDGIFEDSKQMESLIEACEAHAQAYYGTTEGIKMPFRDGDELSKYAGYEGHDFIRCRTKQKITIVDGNKNPIDAKEIYGGCVIRLNVTPLAYEIEDKVVVMENGKRREEKVTTKGVTLLPNAIQFIRDGDSFGGGGDRTGGFDDEYKTDDSESPSEMF